MREKEMKGRTGLGLARLKHSSDRGAQGLSLVVWHLALGDLGKGNIGVHV